MTFAPRSHASWRSEKLAREHFERCTCYVLAAWLYLDAHVDASFVSNDVGRVLIRRRGKNFRASGRAVHCASMNDSRPASGGCPSAYALNGGVCISPARQTLADTMNRKLCARRQR